MVINCQEKENKIKNKYSLDIADLTQTIIIIAGLAVAAIVGIGSVAAVTMEKGENVADCIANKNFFNTQEGINECKNEEDEEENQEELEEEQEIHFNWVLTKHYSDKYDMNKNSKRYNAVYESNIGFGDYGYDATNLTEAGQQAMLDFQQYLMDNPLVYEQVASMSLAERQEWSNNKIISFMDEDNAKAYNFAYNHAKGAAEQSCREDTIGEYTHLDVIITPENNSFTAECYTMREFYIEPSE